MTDNDPKPIYRIMDLHESDRPRERLSALGPQALSNAAKTIVVSDARMQLVFMASPRALR